MSAILVLLLGASRRDLPPASAVHRPGPRPPPARSGCAPPCNWSDRPRWPRLIATDIGHAAAHPASLWPSLGRGRRRRADLRD